MFFKLPYTKMENIPARPDILIQTKPKVKNIHLMTVIVLYLICLLRTAASSHALTLPNDEIPSNDDKNVSNELDLGRADSNQSSRFALQILLSAQSRLVSLSSIKGSLTADDITAQETNLMVQLQIISDLYTFYGFTLSDQTWQKCSEEYLRQKQTLMLEITFLIEFCDKSINAIRDTDSEEEVLVIPTSVLKICADEAFQLYLNVKEFSVSNYYLDKSYKCSVEATTRTLRGITMTDYFNSVDKKNQLLSQELEYLLTKYGLYIPEMEIIDAAQYSNMTDQFVNFSRELNLIKRERNNSELQVEIERFKLSISTIPQIQADSDEEEIDEMSLYVSSEIFDRFLRILEPQDNVSTSPDRIQRLPRLIQTHNRLVEMILEVTDVLPISILKEKGPRSIYSNKSETFGKPCENSPNHLVGTCNYENNEICAIAPELNPINTQFPNGQGEFLIVSKLMLLTKYCTCGFHVDCVPIAFTYTLATAHSTCFLVPNHHGQCRGGAGYPCGSLPLAAKQFDKSCVSELCNREKNECSL